MSRLLAITLLLPTLAGADALDEALALVLAAHPVLIAERDMAAEATRQRSWSSNLTLSYTAQGTEYGGPSGANAAIRVRIPLFDRAHALAEAQARTALTKQRDAVKAAFLAEVQAIGQQAAALRERNTLRQLYRDRLEYRKQQVDEGLAEADALWAEAEAFQRAEQGYRTAQRLLLSQCERVAREYGGQRWTRLRDLLVARATS